MTSGRSGRSPTTCRWKRSNVDGVPGEFSIVPGSDPARALLFFHGGGYCSGSILSHRRMVTEAGRAGGVRTLAVGFRLAPEHPFPAAYDDALTAWRWLRKQGIAANRIAVGGDSAGGGLTLALAMRLRDAGDEVPGCLWLASPWTDLTMSGATLDHQGCRRSAHSQGLSRRACQRLRPRQHGADRPAHLAAVCGPARTSADAHPGRARRKRCSMIRCGLAGAAGAADVAGHARNLAGHDPRLGVVERQARSRAAGARERGRIHAALPEGVGD